MFVAILCTAFVLVLGMLYAYSRTRDAFHPMMYFGPMLGFLYVWMPARMYATEQLDHYLPNDKSVFLQVVFLFGCVALSLGCCWSIRRRTSVSRIVPFPQSPSNAVLRPGALGIGAIAWTCWLFTRNVQFFGAEGGLQGSGYVIEAYHLLIPCVGVFLLTQNVVERHDFTVPIVIVLALPLLYRGLADGRRGPAFMILVSLAIPWYLRRARRPVRIAVGAAGLCFGLLLMFLFENRDRFLQSGDWGTANWDVTHAFENASEANEYVYGGAAILHSMQTGRYYWGRRYLSQLVVRPVPRYIWPDKYADFGVPELDQNAGTRPDEFAETLGFRGAVGAAPGVVGDLWLEFSWLAIPAMGVIGWIYGMVWRQAMDRGRFWMVYYIIISSLSVYLVMQTGEAVIFRFLIMSIPFWCLQSYVNRRFLKKRPALNVAPFCLEPLTDRTLVNQCLSHE